MLRSRRSTSASVTAHQALFQAPTWGFHLPIVASLDYCCTLILPWRSLVRLHYWFNLLLSSVQERGNAEALS